jgi:hypothetical protein
MIPRGASLLRATSRKSGTVYQYWKLIVRAKRNAIESGPQKTFEWGVHIFEENESPIPILFLLLGRLVAGFGLAGRDVIRGA